MPKKAYKVCGMPRCNKLTHDYVCKDHEFEYQQRKEDHEKRKRKLQDQRRGSASQRGYDSRWRKSRDAYIVKHPLCVRCEDQGVLNKAEVVDHITPHKGNKTLFWDRDNWQSLCKRCHDIKTATEDGGFGRKQQGN